MTRFSSTYGRTAALAQLWLHGEPIEYKRSGQHEWHTYRVIVVRREEDIIREVGDVVSSKAAILNILTSDDSDEGILPSEVNTDTDAVRFAWATGEEPRSMQVLRLLDSQNGFTRVLVQ